MFDEPHFTHEVERLFFREADLLDNRDYDAWLDLLTEDIHYWMPLMRNVSWRDRAQETSGQDEVGWFDDDKETLRKRVRQLQTGIHWAEEPISRISHMITNVFIQDPRPKTNADEIRVSSRFLVYRNRLETETDILVGRRQDVLRRIGPDLKIAKRTILLEQSVLSAKNLTMFF